MQPFVHLHVHSQYSILDGQASIPAMVDKAMRDGMKGLALTDHGNMFGIKEFFNLIQKKNRGIKDEIKGVQKEIEALENEDISPEEKASKLAELQQKKSKLEEKIFKPIFGCEMYVARRRLTDKEATPREVRNEVLNEVAGAPIRKGAIDEGGHHLVVLAKNLQGYHNLIKLVSKGWTEGFYARPRTDKEELEKYHEGLIVCSACLGGEVPREILSGNMAKAEETILWFKRVFGDDYYLELQRHKATVPRANHETYPQQQYVNERIIELAKKHHIKLVCTNDCHFVDEEHAEAHDRLICLSTGRDLDDPARMLYSKQEWLKTQAEMNEIFADVPEALSNTLEVLDKVEFYSIDHAPLMPTFPIPEVFGSEEEYRLKFTEEDLFNEFTRDENGNVVLDDVAAHKKINLLGGYDKLYRIKLEADYLKELTFKGAHERYGENLSPEIMERITFELHIMKTMGFPGYFLIVQDFINAARKELDVSVGPGRGSAAGSVVAYCLKITQIDPLKYDLLFERFLNPDRISLPDIDVDFDDDGRGRVLQWVTEKYGAEKVAHIITYGTMATKLAIKDVARVQKLPLPESDRLTKLIPDRLPEKNGKPQKINLKNCIENVPELQEACKSSDDLLSNTMKYAQMLEGNVRNTGVHACGVIIGRDDITDWVPVSTADDKETGEKMLVTQYEGSVIEDTGLIKMDFLGLKTLSIIKEAIENIRQARHIDLDIDNIPIDDPKTYALYSAGQTTGTFQFESAGMQKYLRELHPSTFEDLIAMNALYRPGPMDYIPQFIARKQGKEPIVYDIPIMEKYLKDTYGITVYQEQVMLLSRLLADFTRGQSDGLRKAMGKKLKDKLDALKPLFISGGEKNGHKKEILEKIWADWEKFASYAFNKSHATCYSWVAFQTAYLKANYPSEYMAAVLSRNLNNISDITKFMDECKAMKIQVLGPDINESQYKFSVNNQGNIRFGLGGIKGVGDSAVQAIVKEREANGPYKTIFDFIERVNLSACSKKTIESLAFSGAFDSFTEIHREDFTALNNKGEIFLDTLIRYGAKVQANKTTQVATLFGSIEPIVMSTPEIPRGVTLSDIERLDKERELVGMYLSAHPLDAYKLELLYGCNTRMTDLKDREALLNKEITFGGVVTGFRTGIGKRGNQYGFLKIEDYSGADDIPLFGQAFIDYGNFGNKNGNFVWVRARCEQSRFNPEKIDLNILEMKLLEDVKGTLLRTITIEMPLSLVKKGFIESLNEFMPPAHQHKAQLFFKIQDFETGRQVRLRARRNLAITEELINFLNEQNEISFKINE